MTNELEPVRKTVVVRRTRADAFRLFTEGMGRWWPLGRFSIAGDHAVGVLMEPWSQGRIVERARGERDEVVEHLWGEVLVWEPPARLLFSWHPGRTAEVAQEVELRFSATEEGGTLVELEHRGFEILGDGAASARKEYEGGWVHVFEERFAEAAQGHPVLSVLFHRPGAQWRAGVEFREQPGVEEHVDFMRRLESLGVMVLGGPFLDSPGGMVILEVGVDEARRLAMEDPSVRAGLLTVDVQPWMTASGRVR